MRERHSCTVGPPGRGRLGDHLGSRYFQLAMPLLNQYILFLILGYIDNTG